MELLAKVTDSIKHQDTTMRCAIPPEEILTITLRYVDTISETPIISDKESNMIG